MLVPPLTNHSKASTPSPPQLSLVYSQSLSVDVCSLSLHICISSRSGHLASSVTVDRPPCAHSRSFPSDCTGCASQIRRFCPRARLPETLSSPTIRLPSLQPPSPSMLTLYASPLQQSTRSLLSPVMEMIHKQFSKATMDGGLSSQGMRPHVGPLLTLASSTLRPYCRPQQ